MLYTGTIAFGFLLLYEYLVYVHRNSRILDLYRRINAANDEFFIPDDYEVTSEELINVCNTCKRWKGLDGSKRKVHISTFTDNNTNNNSSIEKIQHYGIYLYDINNIRGNIHRHFIILEDGTILEIFDQFYHKGTKSEQYAMNSRSKLALDQMFKNNDNINNNYNNNITIERDYQEPIISDENNNEIPEKTNETDKLFAGFEKS